jgi:hypothetical protein
MNYIYNEKKEILYRIIQHCDKKSISDLVPKILIIENYGETVNLNDEIRRDLLIRLFNKLSFTVDMEQINNIASAIIELSENKSLLEKISNDEEILHILFGLLIQNSSEESNYNYTEILNVLINVLKLISIEGLKIPSHSLSDDEIVNSENVLNNTILGEIILNKLETIITNFEKSQNASIEGTFGTTFIPLGSKRVRMVEFILCVVNYFKNIPSLIDAILIRTTFFKNLFVNLNNFRNISLITNGITFTNTISTH